MEVMTRKVCIAHDIASIHAVPNTITSIVASASTCSSQFTSLCRAPNDPSCWFCSNLSGLVAVDLGDVGEQVAHTAGVAPLVVVPADELDEVRVERDAGLGVEDGGVGVAVHVRGDNVVFGVGEDTCVTSIQTA